MLTTSTFYKHKDTRIINININIFVEKLMKGKADLIKPDSSNGYEIAAMT